MPPWQAPYSPTLRLDLPPLHWVSSTCSGGCVSSVAGDGGDEARGRCPAWVTMKHIHSGLGGEGGIKASFLGRGRSQRGRHIRSQGKGWRDGGGRESWHWQDRAVVAHTRRTRPLLCSCMSPSDMYTVTVATIHADTVRVRLVVISCSERALHYLLLWSWILSVRSTLFWLCLLYYKFKCQMF